MGKFKAYEWTEEEIEKLKAMVKTHTWSQICEAIGLSDKAVRVKAKKLGLLKYKNNRHDPREDWSLFDYSEVHGIKATCERYEVTVGQIKRARQRIISKRAAIREAFAGERVAKFRSACYKVAHAMNFGFDKEDFASWACVRILEGRDTTITNLAYDYRDEQGLSLQSEGKNRIRNAVNIKETDDPEAPGVQIKTEPAQENTASHMFELADALKLDKIRRFVFLMHWKDGFRLKEIGKYLNLSEASISLMLTDIENSLLKNARAKALLKEK